jgi:AcrR family transcriptional regulator
MSRAKIIPDQTVHAAVRLLLAQSGDRAASFAAVARLTGLAAPTLVQRFGSQDGMVRAALQDGWGALDRATEAAEGTADLSTKGAQMLLKTLEDSATDLALLTRHLGDPELRDRAVAWRGRLELALAVRLGGGARGRDAAGIVFAAWFGQLHWQAAGDRTFRLKDAIRRVT